MLHDKAASSSHTLHECADLEGLCCFEAAQVLYVVCKLPVGLTWDGCDLAFASMSPPVGTVEAVLQPSA